MTAERCVLAIDIGTQSSRAALVDFSGNILASAAQAYDLESPAPGWAQQDARLWWQSSVANIRRVFEKSGISPGSVAAVAAGSQMHAAIPIDFSGEVLVPAVQLWCDKRCAGFVAELGKRTEIQEAFSLVGNVPTAAWLGLKIMWLQANRPDVYHKTWKVLTAGAYITYQLTGGFPVIDYSEASGSFLMDAKRRTWSSHMFDLLGLDAEKLPLLLPSSQVAGKVSRQAAQTTGLLEGTPVAVGAGDMLCTLLAAGLTQTGRAVDITGTSSIICIYTNQPVLDQRLMNLHHCMPGWITFGISDSGGGSLKWFKDAFCQEEKEIAALSGGSPYRLLDEQAEQVEPGAEGLLFYPYLLGERTLGSPYSRGVFFGLSPRSSKGALARAIMEGVSFEMLRSLEIARQSGMQVDQIRLVGGGAQSPLWCQIKANIYQLPVAVLKTFEGGTLGAAILAGVAGGVFPDEASVADQVVQIDHVLFPDPGQADLYQRMYEVYKQLHDRMIDPFERLAQITAK
ncbi:MAG: FGGY family carbohydrate kinase [Anaerolineaceae bacterium]|jgi:xylulokinase